MTNWWPRLPDDLITNPYDVNKRRLKAEALGKKDIGFEEGLGYRTYFKFDIAQSGAPVFLKYTVTGDAELTLSDLSATAGDIEYTVWSQPQATETAAFTTPVNVYQTNNLSTNPNPGRTSFVSIKTGGSATFTGEPNDLVELVTASGGNRESVLSFDSSDRGFPATIVYVRIARLGGANKQATGIIKQEWTDRP